MYIFRHTVDKCRLLTTACLLVYYLLMCFQTLDHIEISFMDVLYELSELFYMCSTQKKHFHHPNHLPEQSRTKCVGERFGKQMSTLVKRLWSENTVWNNKWRLHCTSSRDDRSEKASKHSHLITLIDIILRIN